VLNVYRIKNSQVKAGQKRPVVFFQHGLLSMAETWISNTPENAPAFVMARAGYDVWLGNNRGNPHSSVNIHYS
jgi:pimeloyl-ACP methyl ester carboxylesterase